MDNTPSLPASADPNRSLRLCFVTADYPTAEAPAGGGMGAHAYALAHAVADLGHEVLVLSESDGATHEYQDGTVRVRALARPVPRHFKLGAFVPVPWVRRSFAVYRELQRQSRGRRFDFVRFPDGYGEGCRYSFSPLAPYSVHLHGPASVLQKWDGRPVPPGRARVESWLERRPAMHAPLVVAGTRWFANQLVEAWSLDWSRIRIIRNPIDVEKFRPAASQSPLADRTILFVGHLQWFKGLGVLAEAIPRVLADHPDAHFEIVGDDTPSAPGGSSMRRHVEGILGAGGALGSVSFRASMRHEELVHRYRDSAALVLPSFREPYGNVVVEAMACGRPCVVSSEVGAAEVVADGKTGIVVPPGDPAALAAAISRLLALPRDVRAQMGREARLAVERTNAAAVIGAQTVDAYRDVIAGRWPAPPSGNGADSR